MQMAMIVLLALACGACGTKSGANRTDSTVPTAATTGASNGGITSSADVQKYLDSARTRYIAAATKSDLAALSSFYTEDAVILAPNGNVMRGRAVIDQADSTMLAAAKVTSLALTSTDLKVSGDLAVETGRWERTIQPKAGKEAHALGKYLLVWKRQADGTWKIFRESYTMDTGAA